MRRVAASAAGAAATVAVVGCSEQEPGAFSPRSADARDVGFLFWAMVLTGAAVFTVVIVLLVVAGRGRRSDDELGAVERRSGRLVFGGGVLLPVVILVPLSVLMLIVGNRMSPDRDVELEVEVVGHQFWWAIRYPDGTETANELHIPVDTSVRVVLHANDVIHSFWVPQLAGKIDMIPGETTELVIRADEPGTYLGQCGEFCGVQHARMRFLVVAEPAAEFEAWWDAQAADAERPEGAAAERGEVVFAEFGCAACHTVRGTMAEGELGPDLTHVASRSTLGAATVVNDRDRMADWVSDPQGIKPGNLMPPSPLRRDQLRDLLDYLEGLE
jgi:cytochrome c oxidase subunit II